MVWDKACGILVKDFLTSTGILRSIANRQLYGRAVGRVMITDAMDSDVSFLLVRCGGGRSMEVIRCQTENEVAYALV